MSDTIKARNCAPVDPFEDADEQLKTWAKERQREYEVETLLDRELGLEEPEVGRDVYMLACRDLKARGIDPDTVDGSTLLAALRRVSA